MNELYIVTFYSMGNPNHHKKVLVVGMKNHLAAITYAINRKNDIISMNQFKNYNRVECQILRATKDQVAKNSSFDLYVLV